jgi:hypothetical protein
MLTKLAKAAPVSPVELRQYRAQLDVARTIERQLIDIARHV